MSHGTCAPIAYQDTGNDIMKRALLTKTIRDTLETFQCSAPGNESKEWRINCGQCEEFAMIIVDRIEEARMMHTEDYDFDDEELGHAWIEYKGKHYDAECPEGVDNWKELPIFIK